MAVLPAVDLTVSGIISDAMRDAGLLARGDEPNSDDYAEYARRLCDIINVAQIEGIKLFVLGEMGVTLVSGTQSYTLDAPTNAPPSKHQWILAARIADSDGNSRELIELSWDEWHRLSNKTSEGMISHYFVDRQATSISVKFWNIPDDAEADNTLTLVVRKQIDNPTNLTDDVSFPQEWRMYLRWALADDICTGQPVAIMDRCQQRMLYYKEILENADVETAPTKFQPDMMQAYSGGSFN